MTTLEIFDPQMCCPTGVCGPDPDPRLPQFATDLAWLARRGVRAARYNLAREPAAFVANPQVKRLLDQGGQSCLPLILREGMVAAPGRHPTRREIAHLAGVSLEDGP